MGYGLFFALSPLQAQTAIKKFSLELKNESLPEALKQLEKAGGKNILFTYNGTESYRVTVSIREKTEREAIGSKYEILALTDVSYILFWFNELPLLCENRYREIIDQAEGPLTYTPMVMNPRLFYLINDVAAYLDESTPACGKYIDLKCQEMVYMITNYYPLPQLRAFFYPISTYTESFQYFVMQNYSKAKNVEEFAHLGGYNTTTFRRLFRNLYGVPVYEWMLEKKREGILEDLQHSNMRITEICNRYGFDSLSHLAHFCKDSFGDTPRALRKKAANGEKIGKITD